MAKTFFPVISKSMRFFGLFCSKQRSYNRGKNLAVLNSYERVKESKGFHIFTMNIWVCMVVNMDQLLQNWGILLYQNCVWTLWQAGKNLFNIGVVLTVKYQVNFLVWYSCAEMEGEGCVSLFSWLCVGHGSCLRVNCSPTCCWAGVFDLIPCGTVSVWAVPLGGCPWPVWQRAGEGMCSSV